ncbi:MAG: hypothetical protein KME25_30605 [Symplocastrum torsivum CPER-KK1]|jgi:Ca2+-binding RTX toxin-like protein|uniref:Calcium-binding protein n=1 Tax=Symplocastrum torsivum CPER-KK1 TaxID=450513 RepID=A0A951PU17_9CYAN|nr:hypothetical protein [Symplocastrum torsivum CPER-KK1]
MPIHQETSGNDTPLFNADSDLMYGFTSNGNFDRGSSKGSLYRWWQNRILLRGGGDNDTLVGGEENEIIVGGYGDDLIFDGGGNDILFGGYGNDGFGGDSGNDCYVLRAGYGTDFIDGFEDGQDSFFLAGDLTFEQITITKSFGVDYSTFQISITSTGEVLMDLATSSTADLTAADFISI